MCASGYACLGGAATATANDGVTGVRCVAGQLCPSGVTFPKPCTPGYYCATPASGVVDGPCSANYYCLQGAATATPSSTNNSYGSTGGICPRGQYCGSGTDIPHDCPLGTFNNATGNPSAAGCLPCLGGYMCDQTGLALPYKPCAASFYCPNGTVSATQPCTLGHYCPGGDMTPRACPAGTYADVTGLSACKACPERSYCAAGTVTPVACPAGYYCPPNTTSPNQFPCPAGTFSNATALATAAECTSCPPGWYCASLGLTAPEGQCGEGWFCVGGADTPTPGFLV
jgi:hypothetical protein